MRRAASWGGPAIVAVSRPRSLRPSAEQTAPASAQSAGDGKLTVSGASPSGCRVISQSLSRRPCVTASTEPPLTCTAWSRSSAALSGSSDSSKISRRLNASRPLCAAGASVR